MSYTELGERTCRTADWILMAIGTRSRVIHRAEACARIISLLIDLLVQRIGVTRWLRNAITLALRSRILHQRGRIEPCGGRTDSRLEETQDSFAVERSSPHELLPICFGVPSTIRYNP
jgi:hypothetical protein